MRNLVALTIALIIGSSAALLAGPAVAPTTIRNDFYQGIRTLFVHDLDGNDLLTAPATSTGFPLNETFNDMLLNDANGFYTFARDDSGSVAIRASSAGGGPANLQILPQGPRDFDLGGSQTRFIRFNTNGTGNSEIVLPDESISTSEIENSAISFVKQSHVTIGGAPAATCTAGQIHIDTNENNDSNCTTTNINSLCLCVATDTWVALENN